MTEGKKDIWLDKSFSLGDRLGLDEVTSAEAILDEEKTMAGLRPGSFADYIGQAVIKDNLGIACSAAANRNEPLDHLLIHGPPGLGKTSLARVIANELGVNFKSTSGPVIEKPGDLAAILTGLGSRDVIFIDEIHRLPRIVEEVLYPAMEDYQLDILIGQGPAAKSIKVELKPFTLVGATTRAGLLTSPLRDRFGLSYRVEFYEPQELKAIVKRSARILGTPISEEAALEIGSRSRGTPRIANRLLKRVRDYAQELGGGGIDLDSVKSALARLNIDGEGLDHMDRQILKTIIEKFNGGPVGIETIAVSLGEDKQTVEDVYEPFLIQKGFLVRTRRGREVTEQAYEHLGCQAQISRQGKLRF
jgi:Holliday junction DNA helicase RuvB